MRGPGFLKWAAMSFLTRSASCPVAPLSTPSPLVPVQPVVSASVSLWQRRQNEEPDEVAHLGAVVASHCYIEGAIFSLRPRFVSVLAPRIVLFDSGFLRSFQKTYFCELSIRGTRFFIFKRDSHAKIWKIWTHSHSDNGFHGNQSCVKRLIFGQAFGKPLLEWILRRVTRLLLGEGAQYVPLGSRNTKTWLPSYFVVKRPYSVMELSLRAVYLI